LIKGTKNHVTESEHMPVRRRWRWTFFIAWTVFVTLAVWWLTTRGATPQSYAAWFGGGGTGGNATFLERVGNWLKLADLNFRRIYPWILLAPYVAWLGARFLLERGQWKASIPVHLSGCVLFALGSHALGEYADWWRPVFVTISTVEGTQLPEKAGLTNQLTTRTNITMVTGSDGPGDGFQGGMGGVFHLSDGMLVSKKVVVQRRRLPNPIDLLDLFVYASLVGIVQTVHFHGRAREREKRAAALEAQLTKARLDALQAQLHPHFLFNALNAISTLLRSDTRAAQDALASFSELLRLALCHSTHPEVTLREDLEFLARYIEIQQTRLGERLCFEQVVAPEFLDCLVPALLLQPLVENAIRHGIEPSPSPGLVRVVVRSQADRLVLTVEDNGAGLGQEEGHFGGAGIGLQNLRSRLETLYGAAHKIDFEPRPEGGVAVTVEIPLRQAPLPQAAKTVS
jgi:two-component sensor histidine kinase